MKRQVLRWLAFAAMLTIVAPVVAPPLLALPYKERIGAHIVRSAEPITPAVREAVADADRRVAASPSGDYRAPDQPIFLTGWLGVVLAGGNRARWFCGDACRQ